MNLPKLCVKRPVATLMFFILVLILGVLSLMSLNMDFLPKIEPPVASVLVAWPGASATDVENEISKKLEDHLAMIGGIKEVYSKSVDNLSVVTLLFNWGEDMDVKVNDIRDALNFAKRDLPPDIEEPIIFRLSSGTVPVVEIAVRADKNFEMLRHIAQKKISDKLKQVAGVGNILIYGGLEREIKVLLDTEKIEAYNINIQKLKQIIKMENLNVPAGSIKNKELEFFVRVPGKFKSVSELANVVVGMHKGNIVRLKDIAKVKDGFKEPMMYGWQDGAPSVILIVLKNNDANTVEVVKGVKQKLKEIEKELPPYVKTSIIFDSSEYIYLSLNNLISSLFIGIGLVLLITYMFLGNLRASILIGGAIPFSLIITFFIMKLAGFTINVMTMSSLAIASGMVVDNAIVVVDNIIEHRLRGERRRVAAVLGAQEVGAAIMASTLTTVAVFVPLIFITGITSVMFKSLGVVLITAVLASVVVALTAVPVGSVYFISDRPRQGIIAKIGNKLLVALENGYRDLIGWSLKHKAIVISLALLLFGMTIFGFRFISTEFLPELDTGELSITLRLKEGTPLEVTDSVVRKIMNYCMKTIPERESVIAWDGQTEEGYGIAAGFEEGPNVGSISLKLVSVVDRNRSAADIANQIRQYVKEIPGIEKINVIVTSSVRAMFLGASPIVIEIYGDDLKQLVSVAKKIKEGIQQIPGIVDANVGQKEDRPELHVIVDRDKASTLGVNVALVADSLRTYLYGSRVTGFREKGEEYDINVRLIKSQRSNINDIPELLVPSLSGKLIKLGLIAKLVEEYGPYEINRKNRQKYVTVNAGIYGRALGAVVADIEKYLEDFKLPNGVHIKMAGQIKDQEESFSQLRWLLILGIVLVYMVMAGQFEAFGHPLIIMFSVPFAFTGVVFTLLLSNVPLSMQGFLGIVMLVGIVVNNAIVLVDYINLLRARGFVLYEAVKEAGRRRLRPVLMTTLTTFFGMLPLALRHGEGAEMWKALAIVVLGGMMVSAFVTLVLIPVIYTIYEQLSAKMRGVNIKSEA